MRAPRRCVLVATASLTLGACATSPDDGATSVAPPATSVDPESTVVAPPATPPDAPPATPPDAPPDAPPATGGEPPPGTAGPPPPPMPRAIVGEPVAVANEPVDIAVRPGTDEVYVAERHGRIRRAGADAPGGIGEPLLDVTAELVPNFEEGLLGFTFAPDGAHLYVQTTSEGNTRVTAYPVDGDGGLDAAGRRVMLEFEQPYENHNGGELAFGPDGYLYVFTGDGGFVADPQRRALDLTTPKGKILRIDPAPDTPPDTPPDTDVTAGPAYRIPADNPYVDDPDALDEIWSIGLRNPWRASFDPLTGDLWIGDVGDFAWEEINVAWADEGGGRGVSFGWSAYEGTTRFNLDQPADGHEPPFHEYPHGELGCSVSAGERYRGTDIVELAGWFVFADFCSGVVRALEVTADRTPGRLVELGEVEMPVTVRAGPRGELFVVSLAGGIHPVQPG